MTSLVQQALQQCPDTKIVLSGYSQGGLVVHKSASSLAATPPAAGESAALQPCSIILIY